MPAHCPPAGSTFTPPGSPILLGGVFNETQYGKYQAPSRVSEFSREFNEMLSEGTVAQPDKGVPNFMIMTLMSDHTQGTKVGGASNPRIHSPKSMMAHDDYGVGQIVQEVSSSPIWNSTAIFVIEDDAQDGPDHVDCHRSICYVLSPWIKAGSVDHHFYNTDSVLKTMELLLGLPPMNQYDAVSDPIMDWDSAPNNSAPYSALLPAASIITDLNPTMLALKKMDPKSAEYRLAMLFNGMDFRHADAAPENLLNQVIWKSLKGWNSPMPPPVHGLAVAPPTGSEAHTAGKDDDH